MVALGMVTLGMVVLGMVILRLVVLGLVKVPTNLKVSEKSLLGLQIKGRRQGKKVFY